MKKTLTLLLCTTTHQATLTMKPSNALVTQQKIEKKIKGRKHTFTNKTTGLNYDKHTGKVFHDKKELKALYENEMTDCACMTAGATCFGMGALLGIPLCWMAGAATAFGIMPHCCETTYALEEQLDYVFDTQELEHQLKQIIAKEKKEQ
jgi:hypothetical protein